MPIGLVRFLGKVVVVHHLTAHKALQRQRRKHVQAKTKSGDLHNQMSLCWKVVQYVALCLVAKCKKPRNSHDETRKTGHGGRVVRDTTKSVQRGCLERPVDEK